MLLGIIILAIAVHQSFASSSTALLKVRSQGKVQLHVPIYAHCW
jgi:hypothetical protein